MGDHTTHDDVRTTRRQLTLQGLGGVIVLVGVLYFMRLPLAVALFFGVVAGLLLVGRLWFLQRYTPSGPAVYAHVIVAEHPLQLRAALRSNELHNQWSSRIPALATFLSVGDPEVQAAAERLRERGPRCRTMHDGTWLVLDIVSFLVGAALGTLLPSIEPLRKPFEGLCTVSDHSSAWWGLITPVAGPVGALLALFVAIRVGGSLINRHKRRQLHQAAEHIMAIELATLDLPRYWERRVEVEMRIQSLAALAIMSDNQRRAIVEEFEPEAVDARESRFSPSPSLQFAVLNLSFALGLLAGLALPPLTGWGACGS